MRITCERIGRMVGLLALLITAIHVQSVEATDAGAAPAFTGRAQETWINSGPLTWDGLRGKVVLLNVWTYGCINCKRSIPWLRSMYARYREQGLEIIGIHSPEFEWERPRSAVKEAVEQHRIDWPVMLDNDLAYWHALNNRYWPAFYVVDRRGRIIGSVVGETHAWDRRARMLRDLIETALHQSPQSPQRGQIYLDGNVDESK